MTDGEAEAEIMYRVGLDTFSLRYLFNIQMELPGRPLDTDNQDLMERFMFKIWILLNPAGN